MSLNPAAFQKQLLLLPGLSGMGQILPDILQLVCLGGTANVRVISGSVPHTRVSIVMSTSLNITHRQR